MASLEKHVSYKIVARHLKYQNFFLSPVYTLSGQLTGQLSK